MLLACGLAALEAFFSFWLLNQLSSARSRLFMYRCTEVLILLVILKFFTELRAGPASFWNNFLLWPVDFPFNLLTWHYILTVLAVLAAWQAGTCSRPTCPCWDRMRTTSWTNALRTAKVRTLIQRRFLRLGLLVVLLAAIPAQSALELPFPVVSNSILAADCLLCTGHHPAQPDPLHQPSKTPGCRKN